MREDFLAAIIADPADDTKRLIFADWLEEQGEGERAKIIRDQIDAFNVQRPNHWMVAATLAPDVSRTSIGDWQIEMPHSDDHRLIGRWERGFVKLIRGPLATILEHGPAICRENPVEEVDVTDKNPMPVPMMVSLTREIPGFCWLREGVRFNEYAGLPFDIYRKCPGTYESEVIAKSALNTAVLAAIRERAYGEIRNVPLHPPVSSPLTIITPHAALSLNNSRSLS